MEPIPEGALFGQFALVRGLLTRKQLEHLLEAQGAVNEYRPLGDIAVSLLYRMKWGGMDVVSPTFSIAPASTLTKKDVRNVPPALVMLASMSAYFHVGANTTR